MINSALATLDIERYRVLLASVVGVECGLFLTHINGVEVKGFDQAGEDEIEMPQFATEDRLESSGADAVNWQMAASGASEVARCRLRPDPAQQDLWLNLVIPGCRLNPDRKLIVELQLSQVARCIEQDYEHATILDGMATELSTRYEELNLIYDLEQSDEHVSEYEVLAQAVRHCQTYLSLDLVACTLVEEGAEFWQAVEGFEAADSLRQNIRGDLFSMIKSEDGTVVINRDLSVDWIDTELLNPLKLVATPIRLGRRGIVGMLVFCRGERQSRFTNSDRKLCEVVATEISRFLEKSRDPLTGVYNRAGTHAALEAAMVTPVSDEPDIAMLLVDLDRLQVINDHLGIAGGDELISYLATYLREQLGDRGLVGRMNGGEFVLLLRETSVSEAMSFAEHLCRGVKALSFTFRGRSCEVSVSVAVLMLDGTENEAVSLLAAAEMGRNRAKLEGGNRVQFISSTDENLQQVRSELNVVGKVQTAIRDDLLVLFAQHIVPLQGAGSQHFEILIRMRDGQGGFVSPGLFLPAAENYRLMPDIDRWIIRQVLNAMAMNNEAGAYECSINLSGQSLTSEGFAEYVLSALQRSGVRPSRICFEVTETAAVSHLAPATALLTQLREYGCRVALDDFGSGMSSFGYLKNLPVDQVKIDGAFVKSMLENKVDRTFVDAINQVAHSMGLSTVAECIEDKATGEALRELGVDFAQGFYYDKPAPLLDKIKDLASAEAATDFDQTQPLLMTVRA